MPATNLFRPQEFTDSDVEDCMEFFPAFLDYLTYEGRKQYVKTLHGIKVRYFNDPIAEMQKLEVHLDSLYYTNPAVHSTLMLKLILNMKENDQKTFVDMIGTKTKKRFWTCLLLGRVNDHLMRFNKAITALEDALVKVIDGDPLKRAVVFLRLALYLTRRLSSFRRGLEYQKEGLELLEQVENRRLRRGNLSDPRTEEATLFLDAYRSATLLLNLPEEIRDNIKYTEKMLGLTTLFPESYLPILKTCSQLTKLYSNLKEGEVTKPHYRALLHALTAYECIDAILMDKDCLPYHTSQLVQIISEVAECFRKLAGLEVGRSQIVKMYDLHNSALELCLTSFELTTTYLLGNHKLVALTASRVACLYLETGKDQMSDEYIEIAKCALEEFDHDKTDYDKTTHGYLVGLAVIFRNMGQVFMNKGSFQLAEDMFYNSYEINRMLYGDENRQMAIDCHLMGNLFFQWDKFPEAKTELLAAMRMYREAAPNSLAEVETIRRDLHKVNYVEEKFIQKT